MCIYMYIYTCIYIYMYMCTNIFVWIYIYIHIAETSSGEDGSGDCVMDTSDSGAGGGGIAYTKSTGNSGYSGGESGASAAPAAAGHHFTPKIDLNPVIAVVWLSSSNCCGLTNDQLFRRFIRASTFVKLQHGADHRCSLSTCVFCQKFVHPNLHNLELLVRHRFCEFIRAFVRTCAFAWFQTHCDIFLKLLAGEFFS